MESKANSTQRPLRRYKRNPTKSVSFWKIEVFESHEKERGKPGKFFKANLLFRVLEQNLNQIQSIP